MTTYRAVEKGRYIIFLADGNECDRREKQDYIGHDAAMDIAQINRDLFAMRGDGDRVIKMKLWD